MDNGEILQKLQILEQKIDSQNEVIKKVYKVQKIGMYTRYGYWAFFILLSMGAAYYISPFMSTLKDVYTGNGNILNVLDSISTPQD